MRVRLPHLQLLLKYRSGWAAKRKNGSDPHARQRHNSTSHGSPRGLAGAGRRVLNILGGSAPGFCVRCALPPRPFARPPTGARACIETGRARIALPRRRHAASLATELLSPT